MGRLRRPSSAQRRVTRLSSAWADVQIASLAASMRMSAHVAGKRTRTMAAYTARPSAPGTAWRRSLAAMRRHSRIPITVTASCGSPPVGAGITSSRTVSSGRDADRALNHEPLEDDERDQPGADDRDADRRHAERHGAEHRDDIGDERNAVVTEQGPWTAGGQEQGAGTGPTAETLRTHREDLRGGSGAGQRSPCMRGTNCGATAMSPITGGSARVVGTRLMRAQDPSQLTRSSRRRALGRRRCTRRGEPRLELAAST